MTATGTSGGSVSAQQLNPSCRGHVSAQPDHLLVVTAQINLLKVLVNGGSADTTLVIRKPDGSYLCDDDTGGGRNPLVQTVFVPGTYQIHVGSYLAGRNDPYTIGFSELANIAASALPAPPGAAAGATAPATGAGSGLPTAAPPTTSTIAAGFQPDPAILSATAGGPTPANTMNQGCRGHVSTAPNHVIQVNSPIPNLRFLVRSDLDTTLVVRTPSGQFLCDDDSERMNPIVQTAAQPGAYNVWVGTYLQNSQAPYQLAVTTNAALTTTMF